MREILIDPKTRTISEVEYTGDYKNINEHIKADCFDIVRIDDSETIFVDDNGLSNGVAEDVGFFRFDGENPIALAGYGLILATNRAGDSVASKLALDDVRKRVTFGIPARLGKHIVFLDSETMEIYSLA